MIVGKKAFGIILLVALFWHCCVPVTEAHMSKYSYSEIQVRGKLVRYELRITPNDLDHIVPMDSNLDGVVDQSEYEGSINSVDEVLVPWLEGHISVSNNGSSCNQNYGGFELTKAREFLVKMLFRCSEPGHDLIIKSTVFKETDPAHQNYAKISYDDRVRDFTFRAGKEEFFVIPRSNATMVFHDFKEFMLLGLEHIFTGYDHMLFILGLLIVGSGLLNLIKIVTSFTVAHSITLVLATLGLINLSPSIVEPLIALTIVYVGMENLFVTKVDKRWVLTFFFGLIHGLGFAGVLREMSLPPETLTVSLIAFNVGVEAGQLVIVSLFYPILSLSRKFAWQKRMVQGFSIVIVVLALFWFVQRIS